MTYVHEAPLNLVVKSDHELQNYQQQKAETNQFLHISCNFALHFLAGMQQPVFCRIPLWPQGMPFQSSLCRS